MFDQATGLWTSGTFATAARRLPAVAAMGFDVIYLTPVHPIGLVHGKGRNNTLVAGEHDPGSPYAIGSSDGGHDAIHPDMPALGLDWHDSFIAHDLITGAHWHWGEHDLVRLGPNTESVHVVHVQPF